MKEKNILFIGGDKRLCYAAAHMAEQGYCVKALGLMPLKNMPYATVNAENSLDAVAEADVLFLPLPCTRNGVDLAGESAELPTIQQITAVAAPGAAVYGGMLPTSFMAALQEKRVAAYDYYRWAWVTGMNAVPTAFGVLKILLEHTEKTLDSTHILVTGYGRTAKVICRQLCALGAQVTAFARSGGDRASAAGLGVICLPFSALAHEAAHGDFIINTVPAPVITSSVIGAMPPSACIIDIASAPFGTDFEAARQAGITAVKAGSLPGKVTPQSAGIILARGVMKHLRGEEID